LQPLRQEVAGHPGDASLDVAESSAAHEQLAQDQRRPSLGEDLGAECDRAKLTVSRHGSNVGLQVWPDKSNL
jgi:hypothetical protein